MCDTAVLPTRLDLAGARYLSAVVGKAVGEHEHKFIEAADRAAIAHLAAGLGVIMDDDSQHYETFSAIAADVCGAEQIAEYENTLEKFPGYWDSDNRHHYAVDVACDRWTPEISAAFYFGLALGMRLGGAR